MFAKKHSPLPNLPATQQMGRLCKPQNPYRSISMLQKKPNQATFSTHQIKQELDAPVPTLIILSLSGINKRETGSPFDCHCFFLQL